MNYLGCPTTAVNVRSLRMSRHSVAYLSAVGAQIQTGQPLTKIPDKVVADMLRISVSSLRQAKTRLRKQRARTVKQLTAPVRELEAAE